MSDDKSLTSDLTKNIENLPESQRNELLKMAIESTIKLNDKAANDSLKAKNADDDFDRHMQAVRRFEAMNGKRFDRVTTDINTPSGHMSVESRSSKCYIATATYQDMYHPNVVILRDFRDRFLRRSAFGRAFIRLYYSIGKHVAFFPEHFELIRNISKALLDRIVLRIVMKY